MVSDGEWEKTQRMIREVTAMSDHKFLLLHHLLVVRGFLNYVVCTYTWLNPYIKGLHLTIDSWRLGREASSFKLKGKDLERAMAAWAESRATLCRRADDSLEEDTPLHTEEALVEVRAVPRLWRDVACLQELTESRNSPRQLFRAKHVMAFLVIGDASSSGKGVAVVEQYGVDYESGPWRMKWRKESSNMREA
jgi:hypothetical protein